MQGGGLSIVLWHCPASCIDKPPFRCLGRFPGASAAPFGDVTLAGTTATCGLDLVYSFGVRGVRGEAPCEVHGMVVNGLLVATLGHEVQGDRVLSHAFYGSRKVLDAVARMHAQDPQAIVNEGGWSFIYDADGAPVALEQVGGSAPRLAARMGDAAGDACAPPQAPLATAAAAVVA